MAWYTDDESALVVEQIRRARWPGRGSFRCPSCGRAVNYKPGGVIGPGGDLFDIPPCDGCGKRPRHEVRRHHGLVLDDDDD
jgi:hypothetical protein